LIDLLRILESARALYDEPKSELAYRHAISALISYPRELQNWREVKGLKGFGPKMVEIIREYFTSGIIKEAEMLKKSEEFKCLTAFV